MNPRSSITHIDTIFICLFFQWKKMYSRNDEHQVWFHSNKKPQEPHPSKSLNPRYCFTYTDTIFIYYFLFKKQVVWRNETRYSSIQTRNSHQTLQLYTPPLKTHSQLLVPYPLTKIKSHTLMIIKRQKFVIKHNNKKNQQNNDIKQMHSHLHKLHKNQIFEEEKLKIWPKKKNHTLATTWRRA